MQTRYLLGWREWVSLPDLGIDEIKCKIDTGAKTSALHAFYIDPFEENGIKKIRFGIHPKQDDLTTVLHCVADVLDRRVVTSSNGEKSTRYVIKTKMQLGEHTREIELTLTNRDTMRFRMLLGRRAMKDFFIVDPSLSYQNGIIFKDKK
ncbi:MAG TPA: ATP-dependent zinc protease [Epsilonproteobacteria bacterium]|nr:ATP-dependent zinc protease [Campylobacterota bacterium]